MGFFSMPKYCSKNRLWSTVSKRKMIFRPTTRVQLNLAKQVGRTMGNFRNQWVLVMICDDQWWFRLSISSNDAANTEKTCFSFGNDKKTFNIPKALHIGIFGLEIFQRHRWTSKDTRFLFIEIDKRYTAKLFSLYSSCLFGILTSTFRIVFFSQSFTNLGGSDLIFSGRQKTARFSSVRYLLCQRFQGWTCDHDLNHSEVFDVLDVSASYEHVYYIYIYHTYKLQHRYDMYIINIHYTDIPSPSLWLHHIKVCSIRVVQDSLIPKTRTEYLQYCYFYLIISIISGIVFDNLRHVRKSLGQQRALSISRWSPPSWRAGPAVVLTNFSPWNRGSTRGFLLGLYTASIVPHGTKCKKKLNKSQTQSLLYA